MRPNLGRKLNRCKRQQTLTNEQATRIRVRSGRGRVTVMRVQAVVAIVSSFLAASASCFCVSPSTIAVATTSNRRTSTSTCNAVVGCHSPEDRALLQLPSSLRTAVGKVRSVGRGGGLEMKGRGRFSAAMLPFAEFLPPQAKTALVVNVIGFSLLEATGKRSSILTASGTLNAFILGMILWATLGGWGWGTAVLYLAAGSAVTKLRKKKKESMGIAEGRGGARGPENVWGSAATAATCAIASMAWPKWAASLKIGFVSSLATKLSDTFASEIGKGYGKRTFLITTLKPVPPGTEGAVSLEGTVAGVGGSLIIALFAAASGLIRAQAVPACLIAAFVATNFESFLGATTQGKLPWLTNEVINFVNTLVGAGVGVAVGLATM